MAAEATVETGVPAERLRELTEELVRVPEGFTVNPKLEKMLERRVEALAAGGIDWGHAESLAFASLLVEGIPIRLTGQDTERGTFSHRHLVLHDAETGAQHAPIKNLSDASASFEVYNSPLSEYAALGFEYGYSVTAPEALVLWEAQFGDFINGAQIIVDQFLVSGLAKWGQTSRLTLLLPHGYEGNGPEHSSARLERFLQLAAQENIRIVNATTSAQYFHLLRRQALDPNARPLVVMTPKGLLRLKEAGSTLADLAEGRFEPVLDDPAAEFERVTSLVIVSGKLYYDIVGHELRSQARHVAVARVEQLYPFPVKETARLVASYPALEEVVWAQEEPQNMGAWRPIRHRLEEAVGRAPAQVRRPSVAREPERGLPDLARARTGPDRSGSARARERLARRPAATTSFHRRSRDPRPVLSGLLHEPADGASAVVRIQMSNAVRASPTRPDLPGDHVAVAPWRDPNRGSCRRPGRRRLAFFVPAAIVALLAVAILLAGVARACRSSPSRGLSAFFGFSAFRGLSAFRGFSAFRGLSAFRGSSAFSGSSASFGSSAGSVTGAAGGAASGVTGCSTGPARARRASATASTEAASGGRRSWRARCPPSARRPAARRRGAARDALLGRSDQRAARRTVAVGASGAASCRIGGSSGKTTAPGSVNEMENAIPRAPPAMRRMTVGLMFSPAAADRVHMTYRPHVTSL